MPRWSRREDKVGGENALVKLYRSVPQPLQRLVSKTTTWIGIDAHLILLSDSVLRRRGWFRSFGEGPVDHEGCPLPWMPYSFIDFASERIDDSMRVFEFGSGNSTRWWAEHCDEVISVEDNRKWYERIKSQLPANSQVVYRSSEGFAGEITNYGSFDIVVVDGSERVQCVKKSIKHLTDEGVIVFDDTYRDEYEPAFELLEKENFSEIFFQGMGPVSSALQRTSVFYRPGNCFNI